MTEQPLRTDPIIVDAVEQVRDRFGAFGLRELIALAQSELASAEAALAELAQPDEQPDKR